MATLRKMIAEYPVEAALAGGRRRGYHRSECSQLSPKDDRRVSRCPDGWGTAPMQSSDAYVPLGGELRVGPCRGVEKPNFLQRSVE